MKFGITIKTLILLFLGQILVSGNAWANCLDRSIIISRFVYLDPTDIRKNVQDIYKLDLSSSGPAIVTRLTAGAISSPPYDNTDVGVSPDGSRILFVSNRSGPLAFYMMDSSDLDGDSNGDNTAPVLLPMTEISSPHWHSSNKLSFIASDDDGNTLKIYKADITAAFPFISNVEELNSDVDDKYNTRWNSSADYLLYTTDIIVPGTNRFHELRLINTADNSVLVLSDPNLHESNGDWVPGELKIVFSSDRDDPNGTTELHEATVDVASAPHISNYLNITNNPTHDEVSPRFSTDGNCLAFLASDRTITYGPNSDVYIRDLQTGDQNRITSSRDVGLVEWLP